MNVFPIEITVLEKNEVIKGELTRTKAPRTVEKIIAKLPITNKATKRNQQINFPIGIEMGKEKSSKMVKKGDIGYWPIGDAICFFTEDMEPYGDINIIGQITSNLDVLKKLRLISTLKIALTS